MLEAMAQRGIDLSAHRPRQLVAEMVATDGADLVVAMTQGAPARRGDHGAGDDRPHVHGQRAGPAGRCGKIRQRHGLAATIAGWLSAAGVGRSIRQLLGDDPADDVADPYQLPLARHIQTANEIDALMATHRRLAWPAGSIDQKSDAERRRPHDRRRRGASVKWRAAHVERSPLDALPHSSVAPRIVREFHVPENLDRRIAGSLRASSFVDRRTTRRHMSRGSAKPIARSPGRVLLDHRRSLRRPRRARRRGADRIARRGRRPRRRVRRPRHRCCRNRTVVGAVRRLRHRRRLG